ncbi:hypothetical protein [Methanofervidicoccus sp. A16]|uniref:hypothetical protein n=1 Tax=Methanofervidicoccus sp. A16 TaxID=2607662 RepID=UPI00209C421C|nr:hypothetical protein [Methanofervidicoccus sp. A16]
MNKKNNNHSDHINIKNLLREKIRVICPDIFNIKRITGVFLIVFGTILLVNGYLKDIVHFINLGIGLIVVGWIILIFTYDRYVKYDITSNIFNDYIDLIKRLIKGLDIKTSGVVIPPRENLKEGCIYLPLYENFKVNLSILDANTLFVNSDNKDEMGLLFSPLGKGLRKLLKEYREEYSLENKDVNNLLDDLEYLLTLLQVGGDVKIDIKKDSVVLSYRIEDNSLCKKLQRDNLCRKCPCPICGAIILTVAEFLNKILEIESIKEENRKVLIKLRVVKDVIE